MNIATPTRLRVNEGYRVLEDLLCDRHEEALLFPTIVSLDEDDDFDDDEEFEDDFDDEEPVPSPQSPVPSPQSFALKSS
jgi:hypothetical protein